MYSFQYFSVHFTIKILHKNSFMQKKILPEGRIFIRFSEEKVSSTFFY